MCELSWTQHKVFLPMTIQIMGFFWANKLLHAVILQSQESLATTRSGFFPASFTDGWTCIPFVPAQRDPVELPPIVDLGNCELYR